MRVRSTAALAMVAAAAVRHAPSASGNPASSATTAT